MAADLNCDVTRQAVTTENEVTIDHDNFSDIFFFKHLKQILTPVKLMILSVTKRFLLTAILHI